MKPQLHLTKYEQSALVLATTTTRIALDFGSLTAALPALAPLDAALVSHVHADHFLPLHLAVLGAPVWAAKEAVEQLTTLGQPSTMLVPGKAVTIGDVVVEPFVVDHGAISAPISNLGFVFRAAGRTLLFAGDMAVAPGAPPGRADVLLLPVGGGKVFSAPEAAAFVRHVGHRGLMVPLHYHGAADPDSAERFRRALGDQGDVRILAVGETLEVGA